MTAQTHVGALVLQALAGIFTSGVWPRRAPDKTAAPYATFYYFGPTSNYLSGKAGDQNKTLQIDIWANDLATAESKADEVETAMLAALQQSPALFRAVTHLDRQIAPDDPDTRFKRVMLQYSIWYCP